MHLESNHLLGELTHQQFLDDYWQQKPLLIRNAFSSIQPPFSVEELAGLCCDSEEVGRLVLERVERDIEKGIDKKTPSSKTPPWLVIDSPLEEQDFINLPDDHWTLLVNDIERYYPEHRKLLDHFRFIPDWRIDDLMISYAADGGSVGPHVDQYDVFLIQAMGKRHWMLDANANQNNLIADVDLALLADFNPQQEWTLAAGDMLYLPPNLAHYGIAQGDNCMTYSVGFRAPSQQELMESWLDYLSDNDLTKTRYSDAGRRRPSCSGKIEATDISALKEHLYQAIQEDGEIFEQWLGSYLTEPKQIQLSIDEEDDHLFKLDEGIAYYRAANSRLAWIEHTDHILFFSDGQTSKWSIEVKGLIKYLCKHYQYPQQDLETYQQTVMAKDLILLLQKQKILHC